MAREETDPTKALEGLNRAFDEFKKENDKGRTADKTVLAKIEADLVKHDTVVQKAADEVKKLGEQLDAIEKKLNRGDLGASGGEKRIQKAAEKKAAFLAAMRFGGPRDTQGDIQGIWNKREAERKEDGRWGDVPLELKALTISDDTAGGYLAPPDYVKEIIKAVVLISPMRGIVKVRPTGMQTVKMPKRTGTAAAQWVGENTVRTETQNPQYGLVEGTTYELTAEVYVSFADLEDSVFDLEAELNTEFSEQFAVSEGAAVVAGNGVGKPWGFLDPSQNVPTFNSGSAASIADASGVADGVINLFHGVKTAYAQNGRFLLNRTVLGSVRKLKDTQKRYLWEPSPALGMPSTILGAPYTEVPDMPLEAANATPIAFGDWKRAYTLIDRLQMAVVRDPYTKAGQGQVKFVARRRVGGMVVLSEAIATLTCHV